MYSIKGSLLKLSKKMLKKANTDDVGRTYKETSTPYEGYYRDICLLLDVEDVWTSVTSSALDEFLKVDLVLELKDDSQCLVFQVKSSVKGAEKHLNLKTVTYNKITCQVPPVLVPNKSNLDTLYELSEFTGLNIKDETLTAIELSKKLRNVSLPRKSFNYKIINALRVLNLAKVSGDSIVFN